MRRFLLGNTELRVLAVGAYSFAAFAVATVVQILSSGSATPELMPHLARVGLTAAPLLAAGLALDFYCVKRPKMAWIASILAAIIGLLMAASSNAMSAVLGIYSAEVADFMSYGIWGGAGLLVLAAMGSWLVDT